MQLIQEKNIFFKALWEIAFSDIKSSLRSQLMYSFQRNLIRHQVIYCQGVSIFNC